MNRARSVFVASREGGQRLPFRLVGKLLLYAADEAFRLGGDAQHEARLQRVLRRVADGRGRNLDGNGCELGGAVE